METNFKIQNYSVKQNGKTYHYMKWNGDHTSGDVSVRGTRIWFKPSSALILEQNPIGCSNLVATIILAEANFNQHITHRMDGLDVFGDNCCLRVEHLSEAVQLLESDTKVEDENTLLCHQLYTALKIPSDTPATWYQDDTSDNKIVVFKLDQIRTELQEMLLRATKSNVTFHWK